MPDGKWDDRVLDLKFESIDTQLALLRALPAQMATFEIRTANMDEHLDSISRDFREFRVDYRKDRERSDARRSATAGQIIAAVAVIVAALIGAVAILLANAPT